MKKKLVIGNMKMNPVSLTEFERYLNMLEKETRGKVFGKTEIVVCPPMNYLQRLLDRKLKNVKAGVQNIFWEHQGAYTGEVSAAMAKSSGAQFAIAGHSERREYFGEKEEIINLKLKAILKNGLQAILCVGENLNDREGGQTADVLRGQLKGSLAGIGPGKIEYVNIVYEPVWSVGTDKVPVSDEILEAKLIVKKILAEIYSRKSAEKVGILYGGSVKANLVQEVSIDPAMDGVLIGRESLEPYEFVKIAKIVDES